MDDETLDNTASASSARQWFVRAAAAAAMLALLAAAGWGLYKFIGTSSGPKKPGLQQVALIKQPPPPPPKAPDKPPPQPPKPKDEVKLDEPKQELKPDEPKAAAEKPASDKPLGVDAAGAAGTDGFGLASSRGGRDLLSTGGGGGGSYYSGLLQRHFFESLSRNRRLLKEEFRVVVRIWLADDGRVQRADILNGTGNSQFDDLIQLTLMEMSPLKDVPPASMRPVQLRLSNRS